MYNAIVIKEALYRAINPAKLLAFSPSANIPDLFYIGLVNIL